MKKKFKFKDEILYIIIGSLLAVYFLSLLAFFLWGAMSSLKLEGDLQKNPIGLPSPWTFKAYVVAFTRLEVENLGIFGMYFNSILYTFGCAFLSTLVSCITGYLCAKFRYKFSGVVVGTVVVTMALPIVGSTPSAIQLAQNLGLYNQVWGLWIMSATFHTGVHFLILHESFRILPDSFKEAAEVDGASQLQVLFRIMLPLVKNTFITVFLLRLIGLWNDYQTPLLYMPKLPTIAYGLYYFAVANTTNDTYTEPNAIAAAFLVCIPIFVVFLIFQKRVMTNISIGGIKG